MPISVVMVDDHPLLLNGLAEFLRSEPDFDVRAACTTTAEGWSAVMAHQPDILVLDLELKETSGLTLLRRLDPTKPPAVVLLTASRDEHVLLEAVRFGARGIVLKATAPRVLEDCLRAVYRGERHLQVDGVDLGERVSRRQAVEAELERVLTPRELEIVRLVALDLDNEEISRRLSISVGTVKVHLHHVFDKLELHRRQDLQLLLQARGY